MVPQTYNVTGEAANFLYYSKDNLSPGNHILIVNITAANTSNLTFMLDYITYTLLINNTTPTTMSALVNSSRSLGNPSSQPSQVQASGTPQPAAIVGGVIGVLALGVLVTILGRWLFLRRKKAKQTEHISIYSYQNGMLSNVYYHSLLIFVQMQTTSTYQNLVRGSSRFCPKAIPSQ